MSNADKCASEPQAGVCCPLATRKGLLRVVLPVLLVIGFFVAWNNGLNRFFVAKRFGVVEAGAIYRSGQISEYKIKDTLQKYGIKRIIALNKEASWPTDVPAEEKACSELGIDRHVYPLKGNGTGDIDVYADAVAAVAKARAAGVPVLVHCAAGTQRTGGVIAFYRLLVQGQTDVPGIFKEMQKYSYDEHDNPALIEYLNTHMAEMAQKLVDRGVISQVPTTLPSFKL